MKMNKTFSQLILISILLLFPIQIAFAYVDCSIIGKEDSLPVEIIQNGATILTARDGNHMATVKFYTRKKPTPDKINGNYYLSSIVDSLRITIDTQNVCVPWSVFKDLFDINCSGLRALGHGKYKLLLIGGDGAFSYYAEFLFDSVGVKQKAEWDAEMGWPKDTSEITKYYYHAY